MCATDCGDQIPLEKQIFLKILCVKYDKEAFVTICPNHLSH